MKFIDSDGSVLTDEKIVDRMADDECLLFKPRLDNTATDGFPVNLVLVSRKDAEGKDIAQNAT